MEGLTYVQYTGIGGANLDSGIMPMSIGGSSDSYKTDTGGPAYLGFTVCWQFPGGIQLMGNAYPEGAWGYIFGRDSEGGGTLYTDELFCQHLEKTLQIDIGDGPSYAINSEDEPRVRETINDLVATYARRVFVMSEDGGLYDWNRFKEFYGRNKCIIF